MELTQALSLLADLGELEVQSPAIPDPPPSWLHELSQAVKTTRRYLATQRPPAGEFFYSAKDRTKHTGARKPVQQNLISNIQEQQNV